MPRESSRPQRRFPFCVIDLGRVDFREAFVRQKQVLHEVIRGFYPDTLILCEHPPIITLGRLARAENILVTTEQLRKQGIEVLRIDRAGDVTFHGPGQLVAYPIFDLNRHGKDVHAFLRKLEEVVIDFLKYFAINGIRKPGLTGIWAGNSKIASLGIGIKRWVSFHGLSINVDIDLKNFSLIRPCGMNISMTSLKERVGKEIAMASVKARIVDSFASVFSLREEGNDQCVSAGIRRED